MAQIRKITDAITGPKTRADIVENTIKQVTENTHSGMSSFIDNAQPMKTYWYHIHNPSSVSGVGFADNDGPYEGAVKYVLIKDYIAYGYPEERPVDVEVGGNMDIRYNVANITLLHLPNTLTPYPGDRLSFSVENHRFLYKVIHSTPVQFKNKTYIRTEISKDTIKPADYYAEDFRKDGLLYDTYEYVEGNIGSDYSPFMKKDEIKTINTLTAYKNELLEQFNDYFYNRDKNVYMTIDPSSAGALHYTPLLVDLQMEFRTLWTFGINTILTHETLINNRAKYNYRKNIVRRFLNRIPGAWDKLKEDGIQFSLYTYVPYVNNPLYKVQSYFNDNGTYVIYDYYHGDNIFRDNEGKVIAVINNSHIAKIPESLYDLFDKYTNDELTPEYMINFLEEYDFELCFCCMIMVFMVMTILDKVIESTRRMNINSGLLS